MPLVLINCSSAHAHCARLHYSILTTQSSRRTTRHVATQQSEKKNPGSNNQSCLCRTPYRASHIIYIALSTPTSTSYAYWQIFLKRKPCFRSKTLSVVTSYSHFFVTHIRSETKCRRNTSFNNMLHIPQFIIKGPLPNIALSCPSHNLFYINQLETSFNKIELPSLSNGEN